MTDGDTVYKYTVPLEDDRGVERPAYDSALGGDVLHKEYTTTSYIVVCTESKPHFHKDSVNVDVEEVPAEGYQNAEDGDGSQ